ncbi:MAG: DUF192 domain-containing protein [Pseudomonadales bacterium]
MILSITTTLSRIEPQFFIVNFRFNIQGLLLALVVTACQPTGEAQAPADSQTYFPISIDGETLLLQLALNTAEQQKGLMSRDSLAEDHGMLFLFERPEQRSFWMRNTRIPLDIGYFDSSGQLIEVHKLFPYDENPVPSRSHEILIAVETNRGWYAAHGVKPGARLDLDALRAALARRNQSHSALNL